MSDVTYKITGIDKELGHMSVRFERGKDYRETTFCDLPLDGDIESTKTELERRANGWAAGLDTASVEVNPELNKLVGKTETVTEVE